MSAGKNCETLLSTSFARWSFVALLLGGLASPASGAREVLTRFPTLHGDTIVFEAGGNLWSVGRGGGLAQRLTTDAGMDLAPHFSPDGKLIAFTGEYDGNTDVYVIPSEGGEAKRLTFHSDVVPKATLRWGPDNMVLGWTPDGKDVVFLSRREAFNSWFGRLFTVSREGGLPRAFPVPKGGTLSFAPGGRQIAYNRIFRNFRTWKRYYGGLAQDVWIYDLGSHAIERLTDWKGTDTFPMWYGDTIYFASDRGPEKRLNLWAYDRKTGQFRQITHFEDFDVDWPSLGDDGIVLQCGGALYLLDLPGEELHQLSVRVPDDGVRTRPAFDSLTENIESYDIAPNGRRALFGARGEILTVPEQHGDVRDLTETPAAREQYPAWSPDGRWVAYVTDASGEAQIAVRPADGSGAERELTHRDRGYLYPPVWSPDGKKIAYSDSDHRLFVLFVDDGSELAVDADPRQEIHHYGFSGDSLWLTYDKTGDNDLSEIYLYSLTSRVATRVSTGMTDDRGAVFDPAGRYLYFVSARHENPVFSESELDIATLATDGVYVATLRADEPSPFAPRSDEGRPEASPPESSKPGASEEGPIHVDLDGLASRVVPLPIPAGDLSSLSATRDGLYYVASPIRSFEEPLTGETALHYFDLGERKDETLVSGLDGYALSADGTKLLYEKSKRYYLRGRKADDEPSELDLSHLQARVDPKAEWTEMFHQAWRLERDLFFDRDMNGVDWKAIGERYEALLPLLACREDLSYVIGEMLGELHNSHTYVGGGDASENPPVPTALLGVDFGLDEASGRYFFEKIYPGDNSRPETRSPLTEPGVAAKRGDVLLAVNGVELRAPTNPYSLFLDEVGQTVELTLADDASGTNRRDVRVSPVRNELDLRLEDWIDGNRRKVDEASGGKVGYVYLSDMDEKGMHQFVRQFFPQARKQALIVDVRYNGGGFIDQILLERLRRVLVGMTTNRERVPFPIPSEAPNAAMACLVNHYSASDGDIFPYFFRKYGLGPLIGTRTWGGVRGIRGYWTLEDGGYVTIPEESLYGLDSRWIVENQGVEPDIEVDDLPGDVLAGRDRQLERAVAYLMETLAHRPGKLPPPPETSPGVDEPRARRCGQEGEHPTTPPPSNLRAAEYSAPEGGVLG